MDWWREPINEGLWYEVGFRAYAWLMWSDWDDVVAAWTHSPFRSSTGTVVTP